VWNWIDLAQLVFSYLVIIFWISFASNPFLIEFRDDPESFESFEITAGFNAASDIFKFYRRIIGVNCILIGFRLLKYLGSIRPIGVIFNSLFAAKN
jgi:hypothetical protein